MLDNSKNGVSSSLAIQRLEPEADAQKRERAVISMAFVPIAGLGGHNNNNKGNGDLESTFGFAALRMNGTVETWSGTRSGFGTDTPVSRGEYRLNCSATKVFSNDGDKSLPEREENPESDEDENRNDQCKGWYSKTPIRPIGMVTRKFTSSKDFGNGDHPILACCDSIGNISLVHADNIQKGVVSQYKAFDVDPSDTVLTYTRGRYANTSVATALAMDANGKRLAVGGRERGSRLLDVETGKLLWKAKNLPPNPQTLLQHPMWTTTMQFLNTPPSGNEAHSDLLATGTAYKQIQIYDIRSSYQTHNSPAAGTRRPVLYTPENLLTHRVTSICQLTDANLLAVGDAIGDCHIIDMRKMQTGKQFSAQPNRKHMEEMTLGRLVGPGGSIRQLAMHPTLPILACVGLDRKLWTWDVKKRRMVDCVYLKQRLNCMLFCEDESWDLIDEGNENMFEDENGNNDYSNRKSRYFEDEEDEVEDYVNSDDDESSGGDDNNDKGDGMDDVNEDGASSESEDSFGDEIEDQTEDESVELSSEEEPPPSKKAKRGNLKKK
mmetsp:Transcript_15948/g.30452  ORF Transcript_15948/g.30452 Transcript_15948/m.30452 type:complete len:549 (+) Transcript_15948:2-1648(+)